MMVEGTAFFLTTSQSRRPLADPELALAFAIGAAAGLIVFAVYLLIRLALDKR